MTFRRSECGCQTRRLWSFMHMVHSEDKPQHRTNWHSFTWTGLRPTDQSQNCKQAQHWTMGERTAGRGRGGVWQSKEASQQTEDEIKGSPQRTERTTAMQNHDREEQRRLQSCGGCRRLQQDRKRTEEGESQTVITRRHEVLSNTLQGGNSERNEESKAKKRKETEDTQTEQTTAHSPIILQGCNSHTHRQPRISQKTALHCLDSSTVSTERHFYYHCIRDVLESVIEMLNVYDFYDL